MGYFAELLHAELRGDVERSIDGLASLGLAGPTDISFYTGNPKYRHLLSTTRAGAVVLRKGDADRCFRDVLMVSQPYLCYARISAEFYRAGIGSPGTADARGVHPTAVVHEDARVSPDAVVGAHSYVGAGTVVGARTRVFAGVYIGEHCVLGEDCRLDSGVRLVRNVRLGNEVVIHGNTVVGSDGFGYAWNADGSGWEKIYQLGGVRIGDRVEIGAMSTINCGALDDTVIEDGVKMDCQIHIAHNARVGADTAMAANAMVAGSTVLGKRCRVAGGVRVGDNLSIADDVEIIMGSCVFQDIPEAGSYSGIPAYPLRDWKRNSANQGRLHDLFARVGDLEKKSMAGSRK